MASVSAFNDMMAQFISELVKTFPENASLKKHETSFELLRKSNPRKIVETFMSVVAPHQDAVMARDRSVLNDESLKSAIGISSDVLDTCSKNTENAIWQYIQTLLMLGTTITALPAETLKAIESVAEATAGQLNEGSMGDESLQQNLMKLFGGLGGALQK